MAGFVTEVVKSSSIGLCWEDSGPLLAVLEAWLDAFAFARIAVPDMEFSLLSTVQTFSLIEGGARSWVGIASASALNGVPVETSTAVLVVVAHARAGGDIPEVVFGASLG